MTISATTDAIEPVAVRCDAVMLHVELADGRSIGVPLHWFPRLKHGTDAERANVELSAGGLHWPELNEDISVESILQGERSGESPKSLERWLRLRAEGKRETIPTFPLNGPTNQESNGDR